MRWQQRISGIVVAFTRNDPGTKLENNRTGIWQSGILLSAPTCHTIHTPNWNTTRFKSPMHLVTRKSCSRLSPIMTLHFRRMTHSTRLQSSFQSLGTNLRSKLIQTFNNINIYTDREPAIETEIGVLLKSSPIKAVNLNPNRHGCLDTVRMTLYLFSRPLLTCL